MHPPGTRFFSNYPMDKIELLLALMRDICERSRPSATTLPRPSFPRHSHPIPPIPPEPDHWPSVSAT